MIIDKCPVPKLGEKLRKRYPETIRVGVPQRTSFEDGRVALSYSFRGTKRDLIEEGLATKEMFDYAAKKDSRLKSPPVALEYHRFAISKDGRGAWWLDLCVHEHETEKLNKDGSLGSRKVQAEVRRWLGPKGAAAQS